MRRCGQADKRVIAATEADWTTEYLEPIIAARVVDGVAGAIDHINHYGSHHTDSIVTGNSATAERFLNEIDSGIVLGQCLDPVRRRQRVRDGRGDRHIDRQNARTRAGRRGAAD